VGVFLIVPYLLLTFFPILDPFRWRIEHRFKVILLVRDLLLVTFAVFFVANVVTTAEGKFGFDWLGMALGIFLIIYGNYLPKIPQNWSIGMVTPWTAVSEIV